MAGPKRSDAWKTRFKDISLSIIARCACPVWGGKSDGSPDRVGINADPPLQAGLKPGLYKVKIRWRLMIDEARLAGVYSAELLSPPVRRQAEASPTTAGLEPRPLQRRAVEAQGGIALFENAEPSQRAGFFG
jgi:hypothetical protein